MTRFTLNRCRSSTRNQVPDEQNDGETQNEVNCAAGYVERQEAQEPQNQ